MPLSQMRPRTSQLVELHVFYVPEELWNFKLNTVPVALSSKFISAGFIRVSPHITLRVLREKLGEYLGGVAVADKFKFLKCIGKKLAVGHGNLIELHLHDQIFVEWVFPPSLLFHNSNNVSSNKSCTLLVKAKQETELELKSFAPPYALYPELYLLLGVEYFEDVYPLSSSTQQRHHLNAEANKLGHGSRLSSLPQHKPEKSKYFLGGKQSNHQLENQEVHSPGEWGVKEPVPVLHTKQHHNKRIQEKQIQFGEKDLNGSSGSHSTTSHSNAADWESGKSDVVLQTSQQNHLSQDQKEQNTPKWNDKAKGTALTLHVNCSDEQELTNTKNNDPQNDTKLRRDRTENAGILQIMQDQTTEEVHEKQSLQQCRTSKSIADPAETLDNQADEKKQNHPAFSKEYILPPSPPFLALSVNPAQVPAIQAAKNKMVEQLQQMKKDRRHMEKTREELIKKAKGLLEQNKLSRYHESSLLTSSSKRADLCNSMLECFKVAIPIKKELLKTLCRLVDKCGRTTATPDMGACASCGRHINNTGGIVVKCKVREEWKKKYFETKKATASLEDTLNKLLQDLERYHQKLLLQLEARDGQKRPNNRTDSKNYTIIRITAVQHELDQLRRKLDDKKMKLIIEIKMRKQAASDSRALRAELAQKKIHSAFVLQSRKSRI